MTVGPRGGVPRHVPRPQLRGRVAVYGPHLHPWNRLPAKELGCGATTCWRHLDEWARAGVFEQLQAVLLGEAGRLDEDYDLIRSVTQNAPARPRSFTQEPEPFKP